MAERKRLITRCLRLAPRGRHGGGDQRRAPFDQIQKRLTVPFVDVLMEKYDGGYVRIDPVPARPRMVRLQIDVIIDWKLATHIHNLIRRAETEPVEAILSSETAAGQRRWSSRQYPPA